MSEENNNETPYTFLAEQTPTDNSTFQSVPPVQKKGKKHHVPKVFTSIAKAITFGAIASFVFVGTTYLCTYGFNFKGTMKNPFSLSTQDTTNHTIPSTTVINNPNIHSTNVVNIVDQVMPSTVTISSTFDDSYNFFGYEYKDEKIGDGSGIIIGKNDSQLFIATNNHVVANALTTTINFIDGSKVSGKVLGNNAAADLAVVTVDLKDVSKETLDKITVAKLGDSDDVKVGQMVVAIGNALGYGQSVTVGYVSAKDRNITVDNNTLTVLQTDAAINPGNSGGALVNMNGEVIGINSAKLSSTQVEGIGYSIPISTAFPIVDELMKREVLTEEEKGYLGIYILDVDKNTANIYGWPIGIYVKDFTENSAAKNSGILVGDIITKVNDITVTTSEQLQQTVTAYRYGTTVKITVMRTENGEYKEHVIDVTLQQNK